MGLWSMDDYDVAYNRGTVNSSISNARTLLGYLKKNNDAVVEYLEDLEILAHDKPYTRVDMDYRDFENIFSYDNFIAFIDNIERKLSDLENEMNAYERQVAANVERRRREEEERRRREEEERRAAEARASSFTFRV